MRQQRLIKNINTSIEEHELEVEFGGFIDDGILTTIFNDTSESICIERLSGDSSSWTQANYYIRAKGGTARYLIVLDEEVGEKEFKDIESLADYIIELEDKANSLQLTISDDILISSQAVVELFEETEETLNEMRTQKFYVKKRTKEDSDYIDDIDYYPYSLLNEDKIEIDVVSLDFVNKNTSTPDGRITMTLALEIVNELKDLITSEIGVDDEREDNFSILKEYITQ